MAHIRREHQTMEDQQPTPPSQPQDLQQLQERVLLLQQEQQQKQQKREMLHATLQLLQDNERDHQTIQHDFLTLRRIMHVLAPKAVPKAPEANPDPIPDPDAKRGQRRRRHLGMR
jgi:hypothetical protein